MLTSLFQELWQSNNEWFMNPSRRDNLHKKHPREFSLMKIRERVGKSSRMEEELTAIKCHINALCEIYGRKRVISFPIFLCLWKLKCFLDSLVRYSLSVTIFFYSYKCRNKLAKLRFRIYLFGAEEVIHHEI